MPIANAEALLNAVEMSLKIVPRNDYESLNRYASNLDRLTEVRAALRHFSGDHIEKLLKRADDLERDTNVSRFQVAEEKPVNAFALDFDASDGENEAEIRNAETIITKKKKTSKPKPSKDKKKDMKLNKNNDHNSTDADQNVVLTPSVGALPQPSVSESVRSPVSRQTIVARYDNCTSSEIPLDAVGDGTCALITDTALAAIDFANLVEYDGRMCTCRVEMYRCILLAFAFGQPPSNTIDVNVEVLPPDGDGDDEVEEEEEEMEEEGDGSTADHLAALSRQLVAEYDGAQQELEEMEQGYGFPKECPLLLRQRLPQFTTLPWVVLLCHGGYFAGGVFVNGKCVIHKAFQRYVVRKKQGGKQSTSAKEGGSYGSIGSQIRAAQEVKWKIDVRDILIAWRQYIDAANVILYAAPGPQNRSVLTDFSLLPAASGPSPTSPVSVRDARVRKVPLTSHRPNFEEVQRIYTTVSQCNVVYHCADKGETA